MVESLEAVLPWLLEPANPSARYLTLRYLLDRRRDDVDRLPSAVGAARDAILDSEPAASILAAQWPAGYWVAPDRGYTPRYRASLWQIFFLAQLGAPLNERIARAWDFAWDHSRRADGLFTPHEEPGLDDLAMLNGSLLWAMRRLGSVGDPRVGQVHAALSALDLRPLLDVRALDAVARLCRGLGAWHDSLSPRLAAFVEAGTKFLSEQLGTAEDAQPGFYFPVTDRVDLLEVLTVLPPAEYAADPAVRGALHGIRSKRNAAGRWVLRSPPGKMWANFGEPLRANKWVTIRALRVLRRYGQLE